LSITVVIMFIVQATASCQITIVTMFMVQATGSESLPV